MPQFAKISLFFLVFLNIPFHSPLWNSCHLFDMVSVQNHLKNGSFTWAWLECFGPIQSRNLGSAMILRSKANICTTPGDLQAPSLKQIYCVLPPPADICILVIGTSRLDLLHMSPVAPCLLAPVVIWSAVGLVQVPGERWWLAEVCSGIRSASPFHSTEQQALVPRMHRLHQLHSFLTAEPVEGNACPHTSCTGPASSLKLPINLSLYWDIRFCIKAAEGLVWHPFLSFSCPRVSIRQRSGADSVGRAGQHFKLYFQIHQGLSACTWFKKSLTCSGF